jgi:protease-4
VGASYAIADLIEQAKKRVPVVVSMGAVAASGGYLIAAPGQKVFADASTLTGSIGVFLGKADLSGLFKKIDLTTEILSNAPHAGLMSWNRPLTMEGKNILVRQLDQYYDDFTGYVAKSRKLATDKVESAAQGRVWSGLQAKGLGLVDEVGGLSEAVAYLAKQEKLGDAPDVHEVTTYRGLFDFFEPGGLLGVKSSELSWLRLLPEGVRESLPWVASLEENPFLLVAPISKVQ